MVIESDKLSPIVEWMREAGVRRLRMPDGLELELGSALPLARPETQLAPSLDERPAPVVQALADADGAGVCSCGHSWIEHVADGCLRGCSHDVCMSSATSEPEPER